MRLFTSVTISQMKRTVNYLNDTKVELAISLDSSELEVAEQVALTKLAKKVKVPGFREGKAPASVAAKHVDPMALSQQALEDALSKAVAEAFIGEDLQALERPAVDIKDFEPGKRLEFTAEAQIMPKVTLGDYKKLSVTKPSVKIDTAEVDEVLERLRQSQAKKKPVERAAKDGDEVVIDFVGKKDGESFKGGTAENYPLRLGSNSFIPGFEEGIVGKKPGETFDVKVSFPKDYHATELKGAEAVFTVTLKNVSEVVLPELNDEFAAKSGPFKTVAELKKDVKSELVLRQEADAHNKQKDEIVEKLIASSTVPVPDILLQDQIRSVEQDITQNLMYQGRSVEDYVKDQGFDSREAWVASDVTPIAKKRVQAGLVLAELSKVEKVTASTEDVDKQIEAYKQQYANNPQMAAQFSGPEARQDVASRLLTDKTVDHLLEINTK